MPSPGSPPPTDRIWFSGSAAALQDADSFFFFFLVIHVFRLWLVVLGSFFFWKSQIIIWPIGEQNVWVPFDISA